MKRGSKKGVSPVVASVLMVLMVMVLASMVFLWAKGFISEQIEKFGIGIDEQCDAVDLEVSYSDGYLEVANRGSVNVWSLQVKMTRNGNSEMAGYDISIDAGSSFRQLAVFEMEDRESPSEIIIYPALLGAVEGEDTKKVYTCTDSGVSLW